MQAHEEITALAQYLEETGLPPEEAAAQAASMYEELQDFAQQWDHNAEAQRQNLPAVQNRVN